MVFVQRVNQEKTQYHSLVDWISYLYFRSVNILNKDESHLFNILFQFIFMKNANYDCIGWMLVTRCFKIYQKMSSIVDKNEFL